MNLYLLRHGIAAERGAEYATDAERPLTAEGEQKLRQVAKGMRALELKFDLVLTSPLVRARQTAELVATALGGRRKIRESDTLAPGGSYRKLIALINNLDRPADEILLVGHEPDLSSLVSFLIAGEPGAAVVMKKGGLCKLSAEALRPGRCAWLEWLLTPKQLALLG